MTDRPLTQEQYLRAIDFRHRREGGTFITNLGEEIDSVELAIREYGDPRLVIHDIPSSAAKEFPEWKSLHWLGSDMPNDLGPFWRIVDRLRIRHQDWLKLKDFAP